MKLIIVLLCVVLAAFFVTLASSTVTTFKTGPFTVSVDLGVPCNDTNISKPEASELLSGRSYTVFDVNMCKAHLYLRRYDKDIFDSTTSYSTSSIKSELIRKGADKDTIDLYDRTIDGKSGAAGRGYVPKYDERVYIAGFIVSPKSYCLINLWDNETMMISALKTIHITEAA